MNVNGKQIQLARESRELTQTQLAKMIANLSQSNLSKMEVNKLPIPSETLHNIATVLEYPLSFFISRLSKLLWAHFILGSA